MKPVAGAVECAREQRAYTVDGQKRRRRRRERRERQRQRQTRALRVGSPCPILCPDASPVVVAATMWNRRETRTRRQHARRGERTRDQNVYASIEWGFEHAPSVASFASPPLRALRRPPLHTALSLSLPLRNYRGRSIAVSRARHMPVGETKRALHFQHRCALGAPYLTYVSFTITEFLSRYFAARNLPTNVGGQKLKFNTIWQRSSETFQLHR